MRAIKLTFRAVFEQPIGALNPMRLKIPGPMPVEIFGTGEKWKARALGGAVYERLIGFATPERGKAVVECAFARQIEAWQAWGTPPGEIQERMILPEEYSNLELGHGKFGFRQPSDYTHILHAQNIPQGAKVPPAACGTKVDAKCFISTKANVRPSCKKCAEVWEAHYQEHTA